jgi:predicted nucleic acid-binding protein
VIVLDTNVISEPMRPRPDAGVIAWLNAQSDTALFTTSVTVMELRFGVARLPEGKRKADLWEVLDFTLSRLVGPRILPFDVPAALEAARLADAQIAAITRTHGFAIATRDVAPFETAGLSVLNPWSPA